ncbi:hypothetical protein ANN_21265 [Periplaneta americana]|uniref:Uncharacterized protein n=1 Tax=Periplaneta americana TaxID=6978 RepID=A0ABQ8SEU9_PERAM|nr:hypothetical protein ANN_21265 [Periplaneta americana]
MAGFCEGGNEPVGSLKAICNNAHADEGADSPHDKTLTDFDWRNVIFSDEVIVSNSNDSTALVYCMNVYRYDERFLRRINKSGCVRVACWGWMSYDGAGLLERIHGRFTAEVCGHILANVMIPSSRKRYPEGTLFFQQIIIRYTPPTGFKDGLRGGVMSTQLTGPQIHQI